MTDREKVANHMRIMPDDDNCAVVQMFDESDTLLAKITLGAPAMEMMLQRLHNIRQGVSQKMASQQVH